MTDEHIHRPGGPDRRTVLRGGLGLAGAGLLGSAGVGLGSSPAQAGLNKLAPAPSAGKVARLTNVRETGRFAAPYTDLLIPVRRPLDGQLLLVGGDTYDDRGLGDGNDWRSPVGLLSSTRVDNGRILIDGAITDAPNHAKALVPNDRSLVPKTTWLPTDVFAFGNNLYMNLVTGPLGNSGRSEFWRSRDQGQNWELLRWWDRDLYGRQFQQKTYAAETEPQDPYIYVMSTVFDRGIRSGLLLFRLRKTDLDVKQDQVMATPFGQRFGYEGWGYANGRWAWGNLPTTILEDRHWGEICFRAMGYKYVLSWFQRNPAQEYLEDIRAMVFPRPDSNLIQTTEQTLVYNSPDNPVAKTRPERVQPQPYGPFIVPGSSFDRFEFMVSNWTNGPQTPASETNYGVTQWRGSLNPNI